MFEKLHLGTLIDVCQLLRFFVRQRNAKLAGKLGNVTDFG